ncbi:MAG: MFS transporter [Bacteroidetes bacterium]|nr:MFS transporter [Bacteroidota bacterium]
MAEWKRREGTGEGDVNRRNFIANILDGALFAFAMSFVSVHTILPILVKNIGGDNIAVGLVPVVWVVGFNVPQVFVAELTQRQAFKKRLVLQTAMWQRLPWLLLAGIALWALNYLSAGVSLTLFFVVFALAAVGGSVNLPGWFDLVAKLTPVTRRGRLFGIRMLLGSVLGVVGGGLSAFILSSIAYPENYAVLFLAAFAAMLASYVCLLSLREETPSKPSDRQTLSFAAVSEVLRTQKTFRTFLIGDSLLIISTMGAAFYAVVAFQRFTLSDAYAGTFTMVMMAATIAASVVLGIAADRFGHKVNLLVSSAAVLIGSIGALIFATVELYMFVFVCAAIAVTTSQISRLPFLAEIAPEAERPKLIAIANLVTAPWALSWIGAGWLADVAGYTPVYVLAALFAASAFAWIHQMVHEPRRRLAA